jgi:hypothetical protein
MLKRTFKKQPRKNITYIQVNKDKDENSFPFLLFLLANINCMKRFHCDCDISILAYNEV